MNKVVVDVTREDAPFSGEIFRAKVFNKEMSTRNFGVLVECVAISAYSAYAPDDFSLVLNFSKKKVK